ncbi:MAG: adenylyltransferase/cytidyltransferase family protein, partial [Clostridiales bacterium]|nr:adenylyltransferase/cytidyltransferase family protein [Clostridiales bacterium]
MKLYRDMDEFEMDNSVVAIGTFDGLHIGHAALIARVKALAQAEGAPALALTFDRHPLSELDASGAPSEILSR